MNLLDEICAARGFASCIALTYNVDLGWFERFVVRQLRRNGARHFLVLADRARLSDAIGTDLDLLRGLGGTYVALGMKAAGSFHPKMLLLSGEDRARLYVGSGNLTTGGYARNDEIFERWDVAATDASVPGAFESVRRFLDELCAQQFERDPPDFLRDTLDAAFSAKVFARRGAVGQETEIWSSPGSLLARLEKPPSPVTRLRLVAPSFDREGGAAIAIAERLGASTFEVLTDMRTTNLTRAACDAIRAAGGELRVVMDSRRLHAKALVAEGADWALSISGSANLSNAAWRGANVELVSVRRGQAAAQVAALLDERQTTELTAEMREHLVEDVGETEADSHGPGIFDARWEGPGTVLATMASGTERPTSAEMRTASALHPATLIPLAEDPRKLRVSCSAEVRGSAAVIRLGSPSGFGPWAVVHDVAQLTERARPESRVQTALRDLLADGSNDVDGAEKLLKMMAGMWQERRQQRAEALSGDTAAEEEGDPTTEPEWCWVSRTEFTGNTEASISEPPVGRGIVPLPVNLLRRLLFGDDEGGDGDANEGESEPSEDPSAKVDDTAVATRAGGRERQAFLQAAEAALQAYLGQLADDDSSRGASRLLDDLHLLAATLHYAFTAGALSASMLRGQLIRLLRAFLGSRAAPFPRALESIALEERAETWGHAPVLLLGAVLAYNTCLSDLDATGDGRDLQKTLDDLAPALWMRNLVRPAPPEAVDAMLDNIDRDLPRIRQGALWLGRAWPSLVAEIPFHEFARRLVGDARDIVCAEQVILPRLAEADEKWGDEDRVLGVGRDGTLACGWIEGEEKQDVVWLCDSAFQLAEPHPASHNERMRRFTVSRRPVGTKAGAERSQRATKFVKIDTAYVWAVDAGDDGAAARGVEALNRILP